MAKKTGLRSKRARSPQEKKRLSYEKDRRNLYGEATGASRKGIRRRKVWRNGARRLSVKQAIQALEVDESKAERALGKVRRGANWKKTPDASLGEVVQRKQSRRRSLRKTGKTI